MARVPTVKPVGVVGAVTSVTVYVALVLVVSMFTLSVDLTTAEVVSMLTVADPVAIGLNVTLATSWSPVVGVVVPRSSFTDPTLGVAEVLLPELTAWIEYAEVEVSILTNWILSAGKDRLALTALIVSVLLFTLTSTTKSVPSGLLPEAGETYSVAAAANDW